MRILPAFFAVATLAVAGSALAQEASVSFSFSTGDAEQEPDDSGEESATGYSPDHPLSVGLRSGAWFQQHFEPGVGGHLRFRPWSWLMVEGSTDHYFAIDGSRRDHLVGVDAVFPFIGDERFSFGPSLGGSVDIRVSDAAGPSDDSVYQVLVGGRTGVFGELFLFDRLSAYASAQAGLFVGEHASVSLTENEIAIDGDVFIEPVGIAAVGASYAF
ncbi:MAG: hypothetical protein HOV80_00750 [Polyangiaceae bacterium]|nr:hypothetical protein [Polyangiaceae bacterium]